jgi:murein DD-endopeptidase MepM/ murein hydrolase activator NlpD
MPLIVQPPVSPYRGLRTIDDYGAGGFGAPRRAGIQQYKHKGLDFLAEPGDVVVAPITGNIVHIGIAYPGSDLGSIHIVGSDEFADLKVKLLYGLRLESLAVGSVVTAGEQIATAQDVKHYHERQGGSSRMMNHIHMELYRNSILVNPQHWTNIPRDPEVTA